MTPKLLEKIVWAGSNLGSYAMAEEGVLQLAERQVTATRIRRQVNDVGQARLAERDEAIAKLQAMNLPERRCGCDHEPAPQVSVLMMDGGRYQRRDHFAERGETKTRGESDDESKTHWRETKVGSLLSMLSEVHAEDPCPWIPGEFALASAVQEIAKIAGNPSENKVPSDAHADDEATNGPLACSAATTYQPPELVNRDVLASGESSQAFGWQLETRARALNFSAAARQAFVADGAKTNWRIQRTHFPRATPIADLMHALSYAWSAAAIEDAQTTYPKWAQLIWQGDVSEVIEHLQTLQAKHGPAPVDAPSDPRHHVDRALTYFRNNASHMNYPEYRRQGLPLTSAHIESTVKLINRRIKGTEKFWDRNASESVLQLRADYLSASQPMSHFWRRYHANQTGSNIYKTASEKLQSA